MPFSKPKPERLKILCIGIGSMRMFARWLLQAAQPTYTCVLDYKDEVLHVSLHVNGRSVQPALMKHPLPNFFHLTSAIIANSPDHPDIIDHWLRSQCPNAKWFIIGDCITHRVDDVTNMQGEMLLERLVGIMNRGEVTSGEIDLSRDKLNSVNTTRCYERNGIA